MTKLFKESLSKKVMVADHERVLVYKNRQLEKVLMPGVHKFMTWLDDYRFETLTISGGLISHDQLDVLLTHQPFLALVEVTQLTAQQIAVVTHKGKPMGIAEPGERVVRWKAADQWTIQVLDLNEEDEVSEPMLSQLVRAGLDQRLKKQNIIHTTIENQSIGLLYENGQLKRTLTAGRYGYWNVNRNLRIDVLDLKLQMADVSGQEILTKDRVSLRINLTASYRLVEPTKVVAQLAHYEVYVYKRLQLALREAVGTRTLDQLLEDKTSISSVMLEQCQNALAELGIELQQVGVKDIILPGDMKDILNQVVEAQKAAEANVIKRREETAATRSLHNTAKMMENNPTLLRLKELETLEKITDRIGNLTVYGGLDSVMNGLVNLTSKNQAP